VTRSRFGEIFSSDFSIFIILYVILFLYISCWENSEFSKISKYLVKLYILRRARVLQCATSLLTPQPMAVVFLPPEMLLSSLLVIGD